jgi:hypothetical protein
MPRKKQPTSIAPIPDITPTASPTVRLLRALATAEGNWPSARRPHRGPRRWRWRCSCSTSRPPAAVLVRSVRRSHRPTMHWIAGVTADDDL